MIRYPVGDSDETIMLGAEVLQHVARRRQIRWWQSEAGGQLFARLTPPIIEIVEATGPRRTDRRGRTYYEPDPQAEQREIEARHRQGLHFVGDWHTHAERCPEPSGRDLASISESVRQSRHSLNGFVLLVVGLDPAPAGLHLSIHDGTSGYRLHPEGAAPPEPCGRPRSARVRFI